MRIVRFQRDHLKALQLQPAQAYMLGEVSAAGYGEMLEAEGAFTAMDDVGRVLAVAGVSARWQGVGTLWALIACDAGPHMRTLIRATKGYLENVGGCHRVESSVDVGFDAGERLLELLGFEREGLARRYRPDGGDCTIWAKIRQ